MIYRSRSIAGALLALLLATTLPAVAGVGLPSFFGKKKPAQDNLPGRKPNAAQYALIDKAILREKEVIKTVKERAPLVETYIQNMKPDPVLSQVPESDQHFLARVDFSKVIDDDEYKNNKGNFQARKSRYKSFKNSLTALTGLSNRLHLNFYESGFVSMLSWTPTTSPPALQLPLRPQRLPRQRPTAVFDVTPTNSRKINILGK